MFAASGTGRTIRLDADDRSLSKREQLAVLRKAGFDTPPEGAVCEVLGTWWEAENDWVDAVVAYEDEYTHRAEGKRVLSRRTGHRWDGCLSRLAEFDRRQELFCTAFVGDFVPHRGESLRRLQIGPHVFWIDYESKDSWMSNFGEGDCEVVGQEPQAGYHPVIRLPLWAADFVWGAKGLYAVDFNTAPGIRGTGVEKLLPPHEAVAVLEQALAELEPGWTPKSLL